MDVTDRGPRRPGELTERLRWFNAELTRLSTGVTVELDDAVRELRGDSRARLLHPDGGYPDALAAAVAELGRRHACRTHELTCAAATRALAGCDVAVPRFDVVWAATAVTGPHRRRRRAADLVMVVALPIVLMLFRLPWMAGSLPSPVTSGITVSAGLALAWWLASSRRSAAEADALTRWTEEILRDTQRNLESASAQLRLDAQREMRRVFLHLADRLDARSIPVQQVLARKAHR